MKKFLISAILCSSIFVCARPMEHNANDICQDMLVTVPELFVLVACQLDVPSFLTLTCTCKQLKKILDAIPVKHLEAISFVQVVSFGNNNLINRFLAELTEWMFEPQPPIQAADETADENAMSIIKGSFGRQLQDFLGTYPVYSINKGKSVCYYYLVMHDDYENKDNTIVFFLNNDMSNGEEKAVYKYLIKCLKDNVDLNHPHESSLMSYIHSQYIYGQYYFSFRERSFYTIKSRDPVADPKAKIEPADLKNLGLTFLFLMATRKSCRPLIKALLNNNEILATLSNTTLHRGTLISGNTDIQDMINEKLGQREHSLKLFRSS